MRGGRLSAAAAVDLGKRTRRVHVERVAIDGVRLDYVVESRADERRLDRVKRATADAEERPAIEVDVDALRVRDAELGYVSRTEEPAYRLFVSEADVTVEHFSNRASKRHGTARVRGRLMGSGPIALDAHFAPGRRQPEFGLDLRVEDVDLTTLNDLLAATGSIDVESGRFSLYSQIDVGDGRIDGYAKPLFADLDVYDSRQDAGDDPLRKAWEAVVGATSELLANRERNEVATVTDLSGRIESPDASIWQILGGLLRNAFFRAILPGLERRRG